MIYVVTSYPRSGSKMAMQCLESGGMRVIKSKERDRVGEFWSDENYTANDGGLYEPNDTHRAELFSANKVEKWDGWVVKLIEPQARMLPLHEYQILVMLRDPVEIKESFLGMTGKDIDVTNYHEDMAYTIAWIQNRRDVKSVTVLEYDEVLKNPIDSMFELYRADWPIKVLDAAAVVDPSKKRFKKEELCDLLL